MLRGFPGLSGGMGCDPGSVVVDGKIVRIGDHGKPIFLDLDAAVVAHHYGAFDGRKRLL